MGESVRAGGGKDERVEGVGTGIITFMRLSLFSLMPGSSAEPDRDVYETALDRAALADELGFHGFWVAEHHGRSVSRMPSPAVFLAAAAQRTRRVRLGVAVAVLPVHNPLLVAEDYALVDRLSGGRLDLGVGSGISPVEFEALGIAIEEKRARFDEALVMLRHAWSDRGGRVDGAHRSYGDLFCSVPTVQRPTPPIWRAVGSVEAARAAGEDGDGVLFLTAPDLGNHDEITAMAAAHRVGLTAGGRDPSRAEAGAALFTCVAATDEEAHARAVRGFDWMAAARGQASHGEKTVADAVRGGRSFLGSPETIANSLTFLAEAGVTDALLWHDFGGASEAEIAESMRLLAGEMGLGLDDSGRLDRTLSD